MHEIVKIEDFVVLVGKHYASLHTYIATLAYNDSDVDDLLQDTCVNLWRKREQYDPSRDFYKWACGFAYIEVLRCRRKTAKSRLWFDEPTMRVLADELEKSSVTESVRGEALRSCLAKLPMGERELVEARYTHDRSVPEIGDALGRPASTIYKRLIRVRKSLAECIRANLMQQDHADA
ncbi:MAG: sigma-70 family RNA polymerase sigma factor [Planctomycetota bacterium]